MMRGQYSADAFETVGTGERRETQALARQSRFAFREGFGWEGFGRRVKRRRTTLIASHWISSSTNRKK